MIPLYLIIFLPMMAIGIIDPEAIQQGQEPNFALLVPIYLVMIVFSFFVMIIGFGLKSAFYRILKSAS
jgi:hypothetical protein